MGDLIDVFRMTEVSKETRIKIITKLGAAINLEYGMNITEDLVEELIEAINKAP